MNLSHIARMAVLALALVGCQPQAESATSRTDQSAVSSTGETYYLERDELEGLMALAKQGDNRAAVRVADHFGLGEGLPEKAQPWFLMAAERGDLGAMRSLAVYLYSRGGVDNCKLALQWLDRAKRQASPEEAKLHGITEAINQFRKGFNECANPASPH